MPPKSTIPLEKPTRAIVPTVPTNLEVAELSGELRHAEKISGIEIIAVFLLIFLIFTNCKQYNSNDRQ